MSWSRVQRMLVIWRIWGHVLRSHWRTHPLIRVSTMVSQTITLIAARITFSLPISIDFKKYRRHISRQLTSLAGASWHVVTIRRHRSGLHRKHIRMGSMKVSMWRSRALRVISTTWVSMSATETTRWTTRRTNRCTEWHIASTKPVHHLRVMGHHRRSVTLVDIQMHAMLPILMRWPVTWT